MCCGIQWHTVHEEVDDKHHVTQVTSHIHIHVHKHMSREWCTAHKASRGVASKI